jgi:hypothetical protein
LSFRSLASKNCAQPESAGGETAVVGSRSALFYSARSDDMAPDSGLNSDEKIGQSGRTPQHGHDPAAGELRVSAAEARQGVPVGMVRRVLAVSLVAAIVGMGVAFYFR